MKSLSQRILTTQIPWWVYNGGLLLLGLTALVCALSLSPGALEEFVYLPWGPKFGDTCAMIVATGLPCPQCGMTRSFVYAVRGDLVSAFWFNPAGLGLFLWIEVGALIGAVRLARRDPEALTPPWQLVVGWAIGWVVLLYLVPYGLRLAGFNPLP